MYAQKSMKRAMLGTTLKDRAPNVEIKRRMRVDDAFDQITKLRWSCAGHIARTSGESWTRRILEW